MINSPTYWQAGIFNAAILSRGIYKTITLLLPPNPFGSWASAWGSLSHSFSFTKYLNWCFESLGRVTSAVKVPSFFLVIITEFCQSLFSPHICTVSALSVLNENFTLQ